jgi:hypothetical protein
MQDDPWDPTRLHRIASVMNTYAPFLRVGDRVCRGMEGDPCAAYRAADSFTGTVTHLERDDDGTVRFSAEMEDGAAMAFDNRNIAPDKVWDISPEMMEEFRGRAQGNPATVSLDKRMEELGTELEQRITGLDKRMEELGTKLEQRITGLDRRMARMEALGTELEKRIAEAVRDLSGDVVGAYRGHYPKYASKYIDRYDEAAVLASQDKPHASRIEESSELSE